MDLSEIIGLIVLGLVAGAAAATLGIGGGVIMVPALVVVFGFEQHVAQGTSLAVIFPTAVVATIGHARHGRVVWRTAAPLAIAGVIGALIGARIALSLDADLLRRLFAVLLTVLAIRMAVRAGRLATARD
jgi:hypothetical protein